jgi:ABC-2 type transport system permease protein
VIATSPNHFVLLLRNEVRLYLRSGIAKGTSLVFLLISQVLLHLFALMIAWGISRNPVPGSRDSGTIMLAGGLLAMFMLMTSRALGNAVQALYTRGDLDLLLSSPTDRRAVTSVRTGAVALAVTMEVALLVWPFANVFVLFGQFAWFKAYLLVPAMAMLATSVGLALTLLSFRVLGPRRTRLAVQILAVIVGMGMVLLIYLPQLLGPAPGSGTRRRTGPNPFDGMEALLNSTGGYRWLFEAPAHWVMQGFLPSVVFLVAAAGLLALVIHLAGDRIVAAMTAVTAGGARPRRSAASAASDTPKFHGGFRTVIVVKELRLIARDPYLIAQMLQNGLFALLAGVMLWRSRGFDLPMAWLAVIALSAGLAGPLAWITITAEDAPDLLASAPVTRAALMRAKIEAAMLPVLPLCLLPLPFLLRTHPWFAFCTSACAVAASLSAVFINMGNPVAKRRDSFKMRHKGNAGRGFIEVLAIYLWVGVALLLIWLGRFLAGWR